MRLLLIALSFFTRIPIIFKEEVSDIDFFKSMLFLPVIGFFIGIILYFLAELVKYLDYINVESFIIILAYVLITGGLHLDGFADTTDALLSARDKERMFEIMQDSRIGTFGAVALALLIQCYFISFYYVFEYNCYNLLIAFPIVGRFCGLLLGAFSQASPNGGGLAKGFCKVDKKWVSATYFVIILPLFWFFFGQNIALSFIISIIATFLEVLFFKSKLGGISGDQFGLTIEFEQTVFFTSYIILTKLITIIL